MGRVVQVAEVSDRQKISDAAVVKSCREESKSAVSLARCHHNSSEDSGFEEKILFVSSLEDPNSQEDDNCQQKTESNVSLGGRCRWQAQRTSSVADGSKEILGIPAAVVGRTAVVSGIPAAVAGIPAAVAGRSAAVAGRPAAVVGIPAAAFAVIQAAAFAVIPPAVAGMSAAVAGMSAAVAGIPAAVAGRPAAVAGIPPVVVPLAVPLLTSLFVVEEDETRVEAGEECGEDRCCSVEEKEEEREEERQEEEEDLPPFELDSLENLQLILHEATNPLLCGDTSMISVDAADCVLLPVPSANQGLNLEGDERTAEVDVIMASDNPQLPAPGLMTSLSSKASLQLSSNASLQQSSKTTLQQSSNASLQLSSEATLQQSSKASLQLPSEAPLQLSSKASLHQSSKALLQLSSKASLQQSYNASLQLSSKASLQQSSKTFPQQSSKAPQLSSKAWLELSAGSGSKIRLRTVRRVKGTGTRYLRALGKSQWSPAFNYGFLVLSLYKYDSIFRGSYNF